MTFKSWVLLIFLSVLWGGAFFFVAVAVVKLPPLTVVFSRVAIAALCLVLVNQASGKRFHLWPGLLVWFLVMGLLNNVVPFSLLFWAQTSIPSGLASILNATTPVFTMIVAHVALKDEPLSWNKAVGILFGFLGVAVLLGGDLLEGADIGTLGIVACLGAAFSYGLAGTYGRRFAKLGVPPTIVAAGQLTASTLILAPIVLTIDRPWSIPFPGYHVILAVVLLAVLSTALAYIVFFEVLAAAGAVNVALVTLLIPVSAIFLGWVFLGERLDPHHFVGMALIAFGLIAIDGRLMHAKG
jgi:drug/metabolite transporter (DMT)-like permease